jgi:hypothetical protein
VTAHVKGVRDDGEPGSRVPLPSPPSLRPEGPQRAPVGVSAGPWPPSPDRLVPSPHSRTDQTGTLTRAPRPRAVHKLIRAPERSHGRSTCAQGPVGSSSREPGAPRYRAPVPRAVHKLIRAPKCPHSGLTGGRQGPAGPSSSEMECPRYSRDPLRATLERFHGEITTTHGRRFVSRSQWTAYLIVLTPLPTCDLRPRVRLRERQSRADHTALLARFAHSHPYARSPDATLRELRMVTRRVTFGEP